MDFPDRNTGTPPLHTDHCPVADRLPPEMPENQVLAIDTVVDATWFVTRDTSLQWVIDHMDLASRNGVLFNGVDRGLAHALTPEEIAAFDIAGIPIRQPWTP